VATRREGDVPEVPQGHAARTSDQAVSMVCACEHCGHEFEAEPEGGHRLLCGSATSAADHDRVIAEAKIDAVITDPPYGVGIDYRSFEDSPENVAALITAFMPMILRWPVVALTSGHRVLWSYPRPDWIMAWIHQAATSCGPWGFLCFNPILVWGFYVLDFDGCARQANSRNSGAGP
jgi:hypothetical protein